MGRWQQQIRAHAKGDFIASVQAERTANLELRKLIERLEVVRLPLDANDSDICRAADELARRCAELDTATMAGQKPGPYRFNPVFGVGVPETPLMRSPTMRRFAMARIAEGHGITPPLYRWLLEPEASGTHVEDLPAIARMKDAQWWRRKLRGVHATQVEGAAIGLGYVNKARDPYVSNESVMRRAQQNERNAAALEATTATNEDGQEFTLAELAAKGPANKAIRRAELMTRIAGFERIADDLGHVGLFMTMTCPSRMHKWATRKGGGVRENPTYDGTLPHDAQKHLAKVWSRIRAALARRGMHQYGFRIAEPNHDGTPHWHLLVFIDPKFPGDSQRDAVRRFCALVRRYALGAGADRTERGAKNHRCDFKPIDKGRGSAAGYIAKYVAKNIDGYRLDKDLIGNDAIETSHRVETWASTWRIRQFQQIGGPPVGPWRELRRVKDVPANAPAHLIAAHRAVNKTKALDNLSDSQQQAVKGAQWDAYVQAQGGPHCGRAYAIRVEKVQPAGESKYGEPLAPVPVGVSTLETYTPAHMIWMGGKAVRRVIVESARHVWTIVKKVTLAIGRVFNGTGAQPLAPWTRVNNCTGENENEAEKSAGRDDRHVIRGAKGMGSGTHARESHGGGIYGPDFGGAGGNQCRA
ncbi:MAG: replication endonuclease [Rhodoferax sp.]